jgi:hypothetical protein
MKTLSKKSAYRLGLSVALVAAVLLIWLSLGVGIIGKDGDPSNAMYFGVLLAGGIVAAVTRFRPEGMMRAMMAIVIAQGLVTAIAVLGGLGRPWSGPAELLLLNGFFMTLFAGAAWLFRRA